MSFCVHVHKAIQAHKLSKGKCEEVSYIYRLHYIGMVEIVYKIHSLSCVSARKVMQKIVSLENTEEIDENAVSREKKFARVGKAWTNNDKITSQRA